MVAKGNRSKAVTEACKRHGGFYLGSIGGPAARLAKDCIRKVDVLEYPELGMEAVWQIEVEDFPAFVVVDDKGNDFFADVSKPVASVPNGHTSRSGRYGARMSDAPVPAELPVRLEHDSMGEVRVPLDAKWGPQTQRAVDNFPISGETIEPRLIRALGMIKGEAARVNASCACPTSTNGSPTPSAPRPRGGAECGDDEFPVDVFQTGSGTSSNMNINEVLATSRPRAGPAPCTRTIMSTRRSRPTTCSRPRSTSPSPAVLHDLIPSLEVLKARCARRRRSSPRWSSRAAPTSWTRRP